MMNIEQEILKIKERNAKVEIEKAWETSKTRKFCVLLITYLLMVCVMYFLGMDKPFIGAIIPTLGFMFSTFSVNIAKKIWIKILYK